MDGLYIRFANQEDRDFLATNNIALALETEELELSTSTITAGVSYLLKNSELGFYVIAEMNNVPVGSLMITKEWSDWRNGLFWWLQSVYVLPEWRRKGIYRKLYDFAKEQASSHPNVIGFRLYVEKSNISAQLTYEALGMNKCKYKMYEEILREL